MSEVATQTHRRFDQSTIQPRCTWSNEVAWLGNARNYGQQTIGRDYNLVCTTVMLSSASCRHSFRSFKPWLGRSQSRTFVQTSQKLFPRISRTVSERAMDVAQAPASRHAEMDIVRTFCERVGRPPIRRQVAVCTPVWLSFLLIHPWSIVLFVWILGCLRTGCRADTA